MIISNDHVGQAGLGATISTSTSTTATETATAGTTLIPPMNSSMNQGTDDIVRCLCCAYGGCDVRVLDCGCFMHARCIPLPTKIPITQCPHCSRPTTGLTLFPMNFQEIDNARRAATSSAAATGKRGKKRKESGSSTQNGENTVNVNSTAASYDLFDNDCRTGRWTTEEMNFCDKLIERFRGGNLPIVDGIKLNDFLAGMLKSKQSRLTKKMKNASLSSKTFKRTTGFISDTNAAREFSELEDAFLQSISDPQERAEVRFHMQKEWREMFSSFCVSVGQLLDADAWLISVEEMDRRASLAKDRARMQRRKQLMGKAIHLDSQNPDRGVFIEPVTSAHNSVEHFPDSTLHAQDSTHEDIFSILNDGHEFGAYVGAGTSGGGINGNMTTMNGNPGGIMGSEQNGDLAHSYSQGGLHGGAGLGSNLNSRGFGRIGGNGQNELLGRGWHYASPFLGKVITFMQTQGVPFEHVDAWVPSYVPGEDATSNNGDTTNCRLCFAGSATCDISISPDTRSSPQMLSQEEIFNLISFGEYSQKFSFNVGCGLPGRVYASGVPTWEQSVHNAPHHHFERCGGAIQWKIRTVVGLPIPSPNVGRIVVVLYSCHDRQKDQDLVGRLCEEFNKALPSPKWKLVVDIGKATIKNQSSHNGNSALNDGNKSSESNSNDERIDELISLLGEHMPHDQSSLYYSCLQDFIALRLMLLKSTHTEQEKDDISTLLSSYNSYSSTGRENRDIVVMLVRDYMFLKQQNQGKQQRSRSQSMSQLHMQHTAISEGNSLNNRRLGGRQSYDASPLLSPFGVMGNSPFIGAANTRNQNSFQDSNMIGNTQLPPQTIGGMDNTSTSISSSPSSLQHLSPQYRLQSMQNLSNGQQQQKTQQQQSQPRAQPQQIQQQIPQHQQQQDQAQQQQSSDQKQQQFKSDDVSENRS
mmetsp:Transcript_16247/g.23131  ORF Transcript_16247/g.23131 Transcript_16247/m.23131 type:complete len:922 (+) Transcript_16247:80-2845(+)